MFCRISDFQHLEYVLSPKKCRSSRLIRYAATNCILCYAYSLIRLARELSKPTEYAASQKYEISWKNQVYKNFLHWKKIYLFLYRWKHIRLFFLHRFLDQIHPDKITSTQVKFILSAFPHFSNGFWQNKHSIILIENGRDPCYIL